MYVLATIQILRSFLVLTVYVFCLLVLTKYAVRVHLDNLGESGRSGSVNSTSYYYYKNNAY